jgi:DNA-binding MarR family transcriptional regulator
MSSDETGRNWRFLTNHTQVLLCIARDPDIRLRDGAEQVGITERAAQRILSDLVDVGAVERQRHGRRNRYVINKNTEMRHAAQDGQEVGGLLDLLRYEKAPKRS